LFCKNDFGAIVTKSVRRIKIAMASGRPTAQLWNWLSNASLPQMRAAPSADARSRGAKLRQHHPRPTGTIRAIMKMSRNSATIVATTVRDRRKSATGSAKAANYARVV
jgi:hypothetical protein